MLHVLRALRGQLATRSIHPFPSLALLVLLGDAVVAVEVAVAEAHAAALADEVGESARGRPGLGEGAVLPASGGDAVVVRVPEEAVEVRVTCPQRLIWCLASAVRAIRFAIFVLAPSAGPARGQAEAGRLRNNTR